MSYYLASLHFIGRQVAVVVLVGVGDEGLPNLLTHPAVKPMMQTTHSVLSEGMARGITHSVPDAMRSKLANSVFVFSGMKTYQQLKRAGELLLDEEGNIKPFERYWKDIQAIHANYNRSYLQAEYIFATQSAQMASKWSEFQADGDRYLLQYRTAGDDRVRDSHSILHEVTLPADDKFWDEAFPPNGWRCRCDAVQVRKGKYPESDSRQAIADARKATEGRQSIFRFNAGKREAIFPQNHPYFPSSCQQCPFKDSIKTENQQKNLGMQEKKDCYNCKYTKQIMDERWVEVKKYPNGGSVQEHVLTEKNKPDYNAIKHIANEFAKSGDEVKITPRLHRNSEEYKQIYATLTGTMYEGKCPDLSRNGIFYEYESYVRPFTKRKVGNMLSHGSKQSPYIIIDNNKGASDRFIRRSIINRIKVGQNPIKEVWLYEKGKLRLFFKDGQFFNQNTTGES